MDTYEGRYVFLVRSFVLITLIKCLKGHKSLRVLYGSVFQKCLVLSDEATYRAVPLFSEGQLKIEVHQGVFKLISA